MTTVPETAVTETAVPERLQRWNESWLGTLKEDEVHLYYCSLDWDAAALDSTMPWLSPDEHLRADRFLDLATGNSFRAARAALRWLLGKYLRIPPQRVLIGYEEEGKPVVSDVHFNLSHSRGMALFAFSQRCPLGVDVEYIDPGVTFWQVAELAFTPREQQALAAIPEAQQRQAFYDVWTLKEALLKALGSGLRVSPLELGLRVDSSQPPALLQYAAKQAEGLRASRLFRLSPGKDWAAAMAMTDPPSAPKLRYGILA